MGNVWVLGLVMLVGALWWINRPLSTSIDAMALEAPTVIGDRPVVVELFTSQGCHSCPPADAYLSELANDPNILPLSFHVDYWDYIGWKDPFGDKKYTDRQRAYAAKFASSRIYTPQMVVDGWLEGVGSQKRYIQRAIERAKQYALSVPVTLTESAGIVRAGMEAAELTTPLDVFLIRYDKQHVSKVKRGENRGRTLTHNHVVRELVYLGTWSGAADFGIDIGVREAGTVLLAQDSVSGRVVGVGHIGH